MHAGHRNDHTALFPVRSGSNVTRCTDACGPSQGSHCTDDCLIQSRQTDDDVRLLTIGDGWWRSSSSSPSRADSADHGTLMIKSSIMNCLCRKATLRKVMCYLPLFHALATSCFILMRMVIFMCWVLAQKGVDEKREREQERESEINKREKYIIRPAHIHHQPL